MLPREGCFQAVWNPSTQAEKPWAQVVPQRPNTQSLIWVHSPNGSSRSHCPDPWRRLPAMSHLTDLYPPPIWAPEPCLLRSSRGDGRGRALLKGPLQSSARAIPGFSASPRTPPVPLPDLTPQLGIICLGVGQPPDYISLDLGVPGTLDAQTLQCYYLRPPARPSSNPCNERKSHRGSPCLWSGGDCL